jgi:hypothetical protein
VATRSWPRTSSSSPELGRSAGGSGVRHTVNVPCRADIATADIYHRTPDWRPGTNVTATHSSLDPNLYSEALEQQ